MYTVLARKWRPQIFEDLVGQQTVTQTLQNAINTGRVAHAFLFSGPRGVGKTTCARILAKALNCHSSTAPVARPCNECASCTDIAASRSLDVLEIDGASNRGIDEVRELRESAKYQPMRDRFRIYIIDEVHMLTTEAFNALLKILEEPPPHVYFIFATTEFRKVPATIVSRCQPFDFRRIPERMLVDRLARITAEEKIEISTRSLEMIATASEGGLRDALGTLDQIVAFSGNRVEEKDVQTVLGLVDTEIMVELAQAIARADSPAVLSVIDKISEYGIDYKVFYNELLSFYRDLFLIRFSKGAETDPRLKQLAQEYEEVHLLRICHHLVSMQNLLRLSGNLRFLFEMTLVKLAHIKRLVPLEELTESLKKNLSASGPIAVTDVSWKPAPAIGAKTGSAAPSAMTDEFFAMVISEIENQNPRLAAVLENAAFRRSDGRISFFVPEDSFRRVKLDTKDTQDLEKVLAEKLGVSCKVEIHCGTPANEAGVAKVTTPESLVQGDPIVKEFIKTFGGKISKIELKKERYS
ncbi:MAG TPA: DNA polymerase III subunit gamma/tau [Acidobacteriota bacterium]|nr:DNA polymerase III subunit gamma/tau [Acidobacteriota bacterium]